MTETLTKVAPPALQDYTPFVGEAEIAEVQVGNAGAA